MYFPIFIISLTTYFYEQTGFMLYVIQWAISLGIYIVQFSHGGNTCFLFEIYAIDS